MWAWIQGSFPCSNPEGYECDSMQTVPRSIVYSKELNTLIINPIAEVDALRTGLLVRKSGIHVTPSATVVEGAAGATLDATVNFTCTPTSDSAGAGAAGAYCSAGVLLRVSADGTSGVMVNFTASLIGGTGSASNDTGAGAGAGADTGSSAKVTAAYVSIASFGANGPEYSTSAEQGHAPIEVPFESGEAFSQFNLRVLVDTSVIEVYAMNGRVVFTMMHVTLSYI